MLGNEAAKSDAGEQTALDAALIVGMIVVEGVCGPTGSNDL